MSIKVMRHSFTGGEWAPALCAARMDLQKFATACRTMLNWFPHPHGGASNRPGLEYYGGTKDNAKSSRLIPFQFSVVQSYALEFGDYYMRVWKDGGRVRLSSAPSAWNSGTEYVIGNHVSKSGTNYYAIQASTNKDPATETAYWHALTDDIVEIPTPYPQADIALIKYEQSADVIYLWHPSYGERKLSRTAHDKWTITAVTYAPSISAPTNFARSSGTASGFNYGCTAVKANGEESILSNVVAGGRGDAFSWTAVTGADHYNIYESHNGIYYFIGEASAAASPAYTVDSSPTVDWETTPPQATNPFSGSGNYPGCGAFNEQRLLRGRTTNKPQTIWGSVVGSFENMNVSSPVKSDDAFEFTMNARDVNEIRWMVQLNDLIIGTSGSEWKMMPGENSDAITPDSVKLKVQTRWGVADILPIVIGNTVLFVMGSGKNVRDLVYNIQIDGYDGRDLTILAQHIFENRTIVSWAYQQHPDNIVWCVLSDGTVAGLTYNLEHEIWGWHRHETDGDVESVCVIRTAAGVDQVYFIVKRSVNGSDVRYVEGLHSRNFTTIEDAFFVDCGLTYDGEAATAISGLDHLEGESVVALADGNVVKGLTVESGTVTLPVAASKVHVGLPYTCDLEPNEFEYQTKEGTPQGTIRSCESVVLKLRNAREIWIGGDSGHLDEVKFRTTEDYGDPTELFTGDKELLIQAPTEASNRVFIRTVNPLPATVLAVVGRVSHGD